MIRCFKCGAENFDGVNYCVKCNFKLPKIDTKVSPQTSAPKSARLTKILDIGNGFIGGEVSPESVIEELSKQEKSFVDVKMKFKNMHLPKPLRGEFQEQLDIGLDGMNLFLEAIEMIKSCVPKVQDDDEPFELNEEQTKKILDAMEKAKEGNEVLNNCYEKSCESLRQAQDEAYIHQDYQNLMEETEETEET